MNDDRRNRDADRAGDRAARRSGAFLGDSGLVNSDRRLADAYSGAAHQPLEVERAEEGFNDMAHDAREDQSGEEEDAGTDQAREESEHLVGEAGHRCQHTRQAERLERGD